MTKAWNEIYNESTCLEYPLNAHTSPRNTPAIKFLESLGFELINNNETFCGDPSVHYIKNNL